MFTKKRINKILIILITLFVLFWWAGSLLFSPETSFTLLKHEYSLDKYKGKEILKGNSIKGEFKSTDNYLGIFYVNFDKYIKPDYKLEDEILFRFKEKNSQKWQYQKNYRSGYFENFKLFPFGFPVIGDSKNKTYIFEISSLKGNANNALRISRTDPKLIAVYFYPTGVIKQNIIKYLADKSLNSITRIDFIFSSVIFALPLIYFLLLIATFRKSNLLKNKFVMFVFICIFIDIFVITNQYLGILLALGGCYFAAIKSNNLESKISILTVSLLIFIWMVLTFFSINYYTDKLNIWAYFFLIAGMIQILDENKVKIKKMKRYASFIDMIKKYYGKI